MSKSSLLSHQKELPDIDPSLHSSHVTLIFPLSSLALMILLWSRPARVVRRLLPLHDRNAWILFLRAVRRVVMSTAHVAIPVLHHVTQASVPRARRRFLCPAGAARLSDTCHALYASFRCSQVIVRSLARQSVLE